MTAWLQQVRISPERVAQTRKLNEIAKPRGQSLAQIAVAWTPRHEVVTSSLIGAEGILNSRRVTPA